MKELISIYTCIHSLPNCLPSRLPHNVEQSSMCCTVGPVWLSILNLCRQPLVCSLSLTKWLLKVKLCSLVVKNPLANAEDTWHAGSIPGLGRFPGGGHGNPFQYSCLENSMDRGAQGAIVHWVAKNPTWLKRFSMHAGKEDIKERNCRNWGFHQKGASTEEGRKQVEYGNLSKRNSEHLWEAERNKMHFNLIHFELLPYSRY